VSGDEEPTELYVGNLPFRMDEESLTDLFAPHGEITRVHLVKDRETDRFYGTAFVGYASADSARAAIAALHGSDVDGREIRVNLAKAKNTTPRDGARPAREPRRDSGPKSVENKGTTDTVFMGNCDYNIDEDAVRSAFANVGTIKDIRWVEKDGDFKCCGFVQFESNEAADAAVALHGKVEVMGKRLRLDWASSGGSGGGGGDRRQSGGRGGDRGSGCFTCGEEGHRSFDCPQKPERKERKSACFKCGSEDHWSRECPNGQACYTCGEQGHIKADCPKA